MLNGKCEKECVFVGNFGVHGLVGGQIDKTKNLYNLIKNKRFFSTILKVDLSYRFSIICFLYFLICSVFSRKEFVLVLGVRSLKLFSLIFYCLSFLRSLNRSYFFVVGGWLPELANKNKTILWFLKFQKCVLVETNEMKNKLDALGVHSVTVFPNFRPGLPLSADHVNHRVHKNRELLRLVYFGRVSQDKGVLDAVSAVDNLTINGVMVYLDVFGPLEGLTSADVESENSCYKGVLCLRGGGLYEFLVEYDAMVFPSYHGGEGMPGSVIEGLFSGLPVFASDWRYNSEIIKHGYNGFVFPIKDPVSLRKILIAKLSDRQMIQQCRLNSLESALEFTEVSAEKFLEKLFINS